MVIGRKKYNSLYINVLLYANSVYWIYMLMVFAYIWGLFMAVACPCCRFFAAVRLSWRFLNGWYMGCMPVVVWLIYYNIIDCIMLVSARL